MAFDNIQDPALANALKQRKELRDVIRDALAKIEKIDNFLRMYRDLSTTGTVENSATLKQEVPQFSHSQSDAWGRAQSIFEKFAVAALRDVGRPMKSGELIEEFQKRGHPIKGNAVRTAWNRLWIARKKGVLTNDPKLGYWIAGEPLSEEAKQRAASEPRRKSLLPPDRNKGKRKGIAPILTPEQIEAGEKMLLAGKTRIEVAAALGGVSQATIRNYFGSTAALQAKYPDVVIPKRPYVSRPRRPGSKSPGRPPKVLTLEQARMIAELRGEGKSIREIVEAVGVSRSAVYGSLKKAIAASGGTLV
jgi:Helix-turn-helix domain of resolvase